MHLASLLCEIGLVMVALVSALSSLRHPSLSDEGSAWQLRRIIALAVLSCLASAVTCWMSIVGFAGVMRSLRRLSQTVPVVASLSVNAAIRTAEYLRHLPSHSSVSQSGSQPRSPAASASGRCHVPDSPGVTFLHVKPSAQNLPVRHAVGTQAPHTQPPSSSERNSVTWHPDMCTDLDAQRIQRLCVSYDQNVVDLSRTNVVASTAVLALDTTTI